MTIRLAATLLTLLGLAAVPADSRAEASRRGAAIEGRKLFLASCTSCHGQRGRGDGPLSASIPAPIRDLTDNTFMSARSDQQLFDAISGGGEAFHGSRFMPFWKMNYNERQIWDLVAYMRYLHGPKVEGDRAEGQLLYGKYCAQCHGETGRGDGPISQAIGTLGPVPLDFTNRRLLATRSDLDLFLAIASGKVGQDNSGYMPAWAGALTDKDIWDLVAFTRTFSSDQ